MKSSMSPFKQLPQSSPLATFLSRHDGLHCGFITRLDRSPVKSKRFVFAKALALNVIILFFCTGFIWAVIIRNFFAPFPTPMKMSALVTQDVLFILSLSVVIRSTTIPFFFGECLLRSRYGFRPSEIIIRKLPSTSLFNSNASESQRVKCFWRMAVHAINPGHLYSNANALLSSEYWTIEYATVLDALKCISLNDFAEEDLEFAVWKQDNGIWDVCELWRMHNVLTDGEEVRTFKKLLTLAGKEELLCIWQKTPFIASDQPPSPRAYQVMANKFAQEGLDYETLWSDVSQKFPAA